MSSILGIQINYLTDVVTGADRQRASRSDIMGERTSELPW